VHTALWDTTLASRLHPAGDILDYVVERAATGDSVRLAAPAVLEVAYGYQRMTGTDNRYAELLAWFTRLVASPALRVAPLDGYGAIVAGRMRGQAPHPPPKRQGDKRSKTMRQASWLLDIEIAATAFAAGLDIATENRHDFQLLSDLLTQMFPGAPALAVTEAPV
jgi:predicted nucleic acid-binding protein